MPHLGLQPRYHLPQIGVVKSVGTGTMPRSHLVLFATSLLIACGNAQEPEGVRGSLSNIILSDPVYFPLGASGGSSLFSPGTSTEVVYVSLPPENVRDGKLSTIRNLRAGVSTTAAVVNGGFDPVAVEGRVGDTIEVTVEGTAIDPMHASFVVPSSLSPVVVRTDPLPSARGLPLNATMLTVFSEPMDSATLTDAAVHLEGRAVVGPPTFADSAQLSVRLTPTDDLEPTSAYALIVTGASRDMDGDSLGHIVTVEFMTGEAPPPGLIAFVSDRDGDREIYIMNAGGWHLTRLTDDPGIDEYPTWSPNGATLAFESTRDGFTQVYLVNADGSGLRRLTDVSSEHRNARWSPNGTKLALGGWDEETYVDYIYVVNADGTGITPVTPTPYPPFWSPDGTKIAFMNYADSAPQLTHLYVVNVDGSGLTQLTNDTLRDKDPAWSPDGTKIAFVRGPILYPGPDDLPDQIWVMNADGTNPVQPVTSPVIGDEHPVWSPDGTLIAFQHSNEVWVMHPNGSGRSRLTPNGLGGDVLAGWSPDGAYLLFEHYGDIWIMKPDGSGRTGLTSDSAADIQPVWSAASVTGVAPKR
jgi:Tol biopolymer transport system component